MLKRRGCLVPPLPSTFPSLRHFALTSARPRHDVYLDAVLPQLSTPVIKPYDGTDNLVSDVVPHRCNILNHLDLPLNLLGLTQGLPARELVDVEYVWLGHEGDETDHNLSALESMDELASTPRRPVRLPPALSLIILPSALAASKQQPGRQTAVIERLVSAFYSAASSLITRIRSRQRLYSRRNLSRTSRSVSVRRSSRIEKAVTRSKVSGWVSTMR